MSFRTVRILVLAHRVNPRIGFQRVEESKFAGSGRGPDIVDPGGGAFVVFAEGASGAVVIGVCAHGCAVSNGDARYRKTRLEVSEEGVYTRKRGVI